MKTALIPSKYKFELISTGMAPFDSSIKIESDTVAITDGHIMLVAEQEQHLPGEDYTNLVVDIEDLSHNRKKLKSSVVPMDTKEYPGKYPNWKSVIPDIENCQQFKIAFTTKYLIKLLQAMQSDKVEMYFGGETKATIIVPIDIDSSCFGMIMPLSAEFDLEGTFVKDFCDTNSGKKQRMAKELQSLENIKKNIEAWLKAKEAVTI